jgi:hypothetical protein
MVMLNLIITLYSKGTSIPYEVMATTLTPYGTEDVELYV